MDYLPKIDEKKEKVKITTFIKTVVKKAGKTTGVIGVSGGIDSTTSLILTAKALGEKDVYGLLLPSKLSNKNSLSCAKQACKLAKIPNKNVIKIPIDSIVQKTWRIIKHHSQNDKAAEKWVVNRKDKIAKLSNLNRMRLANIKARLRMILIFDHAKKLNALVVGTENRSESLLGYYTRYGDEGSDIEPLRHLYKTQLIALAKHLKISNEILIKPASADLWSGQTDEKELGFSYKDCDPILYLWKLGKTSKEIIKLGFNKDIVERVFKRIKKISFKSKVPYRI